MPTIISIMPSPAPSSLSLFESPPKIDIPFFPPSNSLFSAPVAASQPTFALNVSFLKSLIFFVRSSNTEAFGPPPPPVSFGGVPAPAVVSIAIFVTTPAL